MAKQIVHLRKPTTTNAGSRYAAKAESAFPDAQPNYEIIHRTQSASFFAVIGKFYPCYINSLRNKPLFRTMTVISTKVSLYQE